MPEPAQSYPDVIKEVQCLIREDQWEGAPQGGPPGSFRCG